MRLNCQIIKRSVCEAAIRDTLTNLSILLGVVRLKIWQQYQDGLETWTNISNRSFGMSSAALSKMLCSGFFRYSTASGPWRKHERKEHSNCDT